MDVFKKLRILQSFVVRFIIRSFQKKAGRLVQVEGLIFEISPETFNPQLFLTSGMMVKAIEKLDVRGKNTLDMGTGSGVLAIALAKKGAKVFAVDINRKAIESARKKTQINMGWI